MPDLWIMIGCCLCGKNAGEKIVILTIDNRYSGLKMYKIYDKLSTGTDFGMYKN